MQETTSSAVILWVQYPSAPHPRLLLLTD